EPASGRSSPMMHLISTDLPVPEPPMITRLSPALQAISIPSSTSLRPNDLRNPAIAIFGAASLTRKKPASADNRAAKSGSRTKRRPASSPDRPLRRRRATDSRNSSPSARRQIQTPPPLPDRRRHPSFRDSAGSASDR